MESASVDRVLLDVWGVLHDGVVPFDDAQPFLDGCHRAGQPVSLISNATWSAAMLRADLEARGFDLKGVDAIWTAGEAAFRWLRSNGVERVVYTGHDAGRWLLDGLQEVDVSLAQWVVLTEPVASTDAVLQRALMSGIGVLCANPDGWIEDRLGRRTPKAGAWARQHRERGGRVVFAGKPERLVFELAGATERSLMVGDNPDTDLQGARRAGCRAAWVRRRPAADDAGVVERFEPWCVVPSLARLLPRIV